MWGHTKRMTVLRYVWGRCRQHTHLHLSTGVSPQTLSLADACICLVGCKYVQERLQVRASEFGPNRLGGCTALQDGMQCTAGRVALHCGEGCSALRGKPLFFSQLHGLCHEQSDEGFLARARIHIYIMYKRSSNDGKSFRKRP